MSSTTGGLINTIPDPTKIAGYTPAVATADTVAPTPYAVAPNQTVASNVKNIIADDSPLLQQANARAMDVMNQRGLLNSSQAISAGQSALYDAALPIAQADASTYNQAATNTVNAQNVAAGLNAQMGTNTSNANATNANAALAGTSQAANTVALQTSLADKSAALQTSLQALKGTQAVDLANIESTYKQLMQTSASASSTFNEATTQISTILRDPNTSAEQKASAVSGVTAMLQSSLAISSAIANLDLGAVLDFSGSNPRPV